jgi:hypothetical protein
MPTEYEITHIIDLPSGVPGRIGRMDTMITYKKGTENARIITIPKVDNEPEAQTLERIKKAIEDDQKMVASMVGKKITI